MRTTLKNRFLIILLLFCILASGCTSVSKKKKIVTDSDKQIAAQVNEESVALEGTQNKLWESVELKQNPPLLLEPVMPEFNPLDDTVISFTMANESLHTMLYSLAEAVGINMIISPLIVPDEQTITISFHEVAASKVLEEILRNYDLCYTLKDNIISIQKFEEKFYSLNFLDTTSQAQYDIGGDVLGAGESAGVSGLSGSFRLKGGGGAKSNPYEIIEEMVSRILSQDGKISVNRLSGTLYIKDRPSVIKSASRIINTYKESLARQIVISARIVEIVLSDKYEYGIDWSVLSDKAQSIDPKASIAWNVESGVTLGYANKSLATALSLEALKTFGTTKVISNPVIRAKHGKPSMISVGTSITYKKSEETTTSSSSSQTQDTTSIEVSTIFDGLIVGLIPFIEENGKVTLLINPIKSDVDENSLQLVGSISLPQINIKEISSTISLNNNETIILGGLIDKRKMNIKKTVPYLSSIPFLGSLFNNDYQNEEVRELVIILNVKVI
jgi:MSHA type pilus biogenesis protein MshL